MFDSFRIYSVSLILFSLGHSVPYLDLLCHSSISVTFSQFLFCLFLHLKIFSLIPLISIQALLLNLLLLLVKTPSSSFAVLKVPYPFQSGSIVNFEVLLLSDPLEAASLPFPSTDTDTMHIFWLLVVYTHLLEF